METPQLIMSAIVIVGIAALTIGFCGYQAGKQDGTMKAHDIAMETIRQELSPDREAVQRERVHPREQGWQVLCPLRRVGRRARVQPDLLYGDRQSLRLRKGCGLQHQSVLP